MDTVNSVPVGRSSVVMMVEPISFFCNEDTCVDNHFQKKEEADANTANYSNNPIEEHRGVFDALCARNITTRLYRIAEEEGLGEVITSADGTIPSLDVQRTILGTKPDSIFPNNSISFHDLSIEVAESIFGKVVGDGATLVGSTTTAAVLYPMCPGRRNEIPKSLLDGVKAQATVVVTPVYKGVGGNGASALADWGLEYRKATPTLVGGQKGLVLIDMRGFERVETLMGQTEPSSTWWALEGTGSMNYAADGRAVFATASQRCHPFPFHLLCDLFCIAPERRFLIPSAVDVAGRLVYHTNVVGWVGDYGMCGWVRDALEFEGRSDLMARMDESLFTTKDLFEAELAAHYPTNGNFTLSLNNLMGFAGNAMYLRSVDGVGYVAMSATAASSLGDETLRKMNDFLAAVSNTSAMPNLSDTPAKLFPSFPHIIACPIPTIEKLGGGSVRCLLAASLALSDEGFSALTAVLKPRGVA